MTFSPNPDRWTFFHKLSFRFMAVYSAMYIFYTLLRFQTIPGLTQLHRYVWPIWRSLVTVVNNNLLHVRETLIAPNSSTDTSFSWASQFTMLIVTAVVTVAWTAIDRKRENYQRGEDWLRISLRYFLAYFALYYGIIKLFAVQMPFPSLSQQSTLLGDLSPTRLAWMFVGASTPYQVFSGIIETAAGLFLMFRRTTTLGLILFAAVFGNVVALNFAYDIPVKIMSAHFLIFSFYLLAFDFKRLVEFFFPGKEEASPTGNYWRYGRLAAKLAFIYVAIVATLMLSIRTYRSQHLVVNTRPIEQGVYDVTRFDFRGDTIYADSLRWRDLVLYGVTGSIRTADDIFEQRYKRAYFSFEVDTIAKQLKLKRNYSDTTYIAALSYEVPNKQTLKLSGIINNKLFDAVFQLRVKPYRLAEEDQFHWLQESPQ